MGTHRSRREHALVANQHARKYNQHLIAIENRVLKKKKRMGVNPNQIESTYNLHGIDPFSMRQYCGKDSPTTSGTAAPEDVHESHSAKTARPPITFSTAGPISHTV
jgi:hypothetical protein